MSTGVWIKRIARSGNSGGQGTAAPTGALLWLQEAQHAGSAPLWYSGRRLKTRDSRLKTQDSGLCSSVGLAIDHSIERLAVDTHHLSSSRLVAAYRIQHAKKVVCFQLFKRRHA